MMAGPHITRCADLVRSPTPRPQYPFDNTNDLTLGIRWQCRLLLRFLKALWTPLWTPFGSSRYVSQLAASALCPIGADRRATVDSQAARRGVIPRVTRRLNDFERRTMVKSGAVFIFSVEESGIKRANPIFP